MAKVVVLVDIGVAMTTVIPSQPLGHVVAVECIQKHFTIDIELKTCVFFYFISFFCKSHNN